MNADRARVSPSSRAEHVAQPEGAERREPIEPPILLTSRSRMQFGPAALVSGAYLLAGLAWILVSEWILGALIPSERGAVLQFVRGFGFILVTSLAIYFVLARMMNELEDGARTQASQAEQLREHAEQQRRLSQQLLRAEEDTRRAVAKDLHDGPLQSLTLSFMRLDAASRPDSTSPIDAEQIASAMGAIREASDEIRAVVRALHPPLLSELGLPAALDRHSQEMASRTGRDVRFRVRGDQAELAVDPDVAIAAFRILQEAVANALKHTQRDPIVVELGIEAGRVVGEVMDQGPGFNPEDRVGGGLGLLSMRERAESVGGTVTVTSNAHGGTHVRVSIPHHEQ